MSHEIPHWSMFGMFSHTESQPASTKAWLVLAIILSGVVGEVAFELYAWLVSPALFGPALQPAKLVMALSAQLGGVSLPYEVAFAAHFFIGAVLFPALVWGLHRVTGMAMVWSGVATGLALWFVAQGILAPLIGRAFMMGFGVYTQSSFVAHVGMCVVIALALRRLLGMQRAVSMSV